jgi:lipopolysaccharide/colanic/teichoic acid biosynthesis glycosyltransferase
MMLASLASEQQRSISDCAKRAVDIVLALTAIVLLAIPCALAALLIWLTSPGPVIFQQLRVGHRGRLFFLYKFRSMFVDSPAYAFSPKTGFDSRITAVGRLLRRTCFDEVPQLWNVLRGEMSLVGPRPEMPFIVGRYTPLEHQRLAVKPGITGLWQLSGDRGRLIHENLEYDLYYLRHRNLFMDFAVLLHTLVFAARGI